jgi:hypothetical protein
MSAGPVHQRSPASVTMNSSRCDGLCRTACRSIRLSERGSGRIGVPGHGEHAECVLAGLQEARNEIRLEVGYETRCSFERANVLLDSGPACLLFRVTWDEDVGGRVRR